MLLIKANKLFKQIGDKTLFENINFLIHSGDKIGLVGKNGSGKPTLLKLIIGDLRLKNNNIQIGKRVIIGYLKQNLEKQNLRVWKHIRESNLHLGEQKIRDYLAKFLFKKNTINKKIKGLSGGELTRLELLNLMLKKSNFLILDEPTNNLDIETIEILESALNTYQGTILFVSHDIQFIKNLTAEVYELNKSGLHTKAV